LLTYATLASSASSMSRRPLTTIERRFINAAAAGSLDDIRQLFATCTITRAPLLIQPSSIISTTTTTTSTSSNDSKSKNSNDDGDDNDDMKSPFDDNDDSFTSPFDDDDDTNTTSTTLTTTETTLPASMTRIPSLERTKSSSSNNTEKAMLNIDVVDEKKYSALMWAASLGHSDIVRFLLKHQPNLDITDTVSKFHHRHHLSINGGLNGNSQDLQHYHGQLQQVEQRLYKILFALVLISILLIW
jgi:hypothetical protein